MPVFKNKTQGQYVNVYKDILKNHSLSLRDRGMVVTLLSLPDNWEFTISGLSKIIGEKKVTKVYRENCWDVISVGVAVTSVALVVYFGDWIKGFVKLNLVVLLLLVQAVYVGIRVYVKGCKRARGYY